jgi:hypothetical protein
MTVASIKIAATADEYPTEAAERSSEELLAIPNNFMKERTKQHFVLSKDGETTEPVPAVSISS